MDLVSVLKSAVEQGCSDVHIVVGKPPMMRKNGEIKPIDPTLPILSSEETKGLIYSILYEDQQARFEENLELDCSHDIPGLSRLRVNVLMTRNGVESAMRVIGSKIPAPETLGITPTMLDLASLPRGMVLVTGPTGSGKSTTLACLIERANQTRPEHILSVVEHGSAKQIAAKYKAYVDAGMQVAKLLDYSGMAGVKFAATSAAKVREAEDELMRLTGGAQ